MFQIKNCNFDTDFNISAITNKRSNDTLKYDNNNLRKIIIFAFVLISAFIIMIIFMIMLFHHVKNNISSYQLNN